MNQLPTQTNSNENSINLRHPTSSRVALTAFLLSVILLGFQNCRSRHGLIREGASGDDDTLENTSRSDCQTLSFSPTQITYYYSDEDDLITEMTIDLQNATVDLEDEFEDEEVSCAKVSVAQSSYFLAIQSALASTVQNCATADQTLATSEENEDYLAIEFSDGTSSPFEMEYPSSETITMTPSWSDFEDALEELASEVSADSSCSIE